MELVLPNNYVEVEEDEMMYLEGGVTRYNNWWGVSYKISKKECQWLNSKVPYIGVIAAIASMGLPPLASVGEAIVGLGIDYAANHNGMWINNLRGTKIWWASF